jgi:hypothetical protein
LLLSAHVEKQYDPAHGMEKAVTADRLLPSRELSYAYAVAMHFAQQLELDLRAILFTADYHGWIPEIPLTDEQRKRYTNTDSFIDKATCGLLIATLRAVSTVPDHRVWTVFDRACEHRNRLAHNFLSEHHFDNLTASQEQSIVRQIYSMTADLYVAVRASRAFRANVQRCSDRETEFSKKALEDIGVKGLDYSKPEYVHPRNRNSKKPNNRSS